MCSMQGSKGAHIVIGVSLDILLTVARVGQMRIQNRSRHLQALSERRTRLRNSGTEKEEAASVRMMRYATCPID